MESAYVTSKGQLVIPAKIRRKLGIKPGTKICFVERDYEVLFQPQYSGAGQIFIE
jgi:AbrB family looped-hinge helix DNA binding protein